MELRGLIVGLGLTDRAGELGTDTKLKAWDVIDGPCMSHALVTVPRSESVRLSIFWKKLNDDARGFGVRIDQLFTLGKNSS